MASLNHLEMFSDTCKYVLVFIVIVLAFYRFKKNAFSMIWNHIPYPIEEG